jgi:hypothetical protein
LANAKTPILNGIHDNRAANMSSPLRVGYVPEHFSTPLHFAKKYYGLEAELTPFPSGTGHMITAIRGGEIDVGIGLTEGWVAGLGKSQEAGDKDGGYKIVGTYVETPLCTQSLSSEHPTSPARYHFLIDANKLFCLQAGLSQREQIGPRFRMLIPSRAVRLASRGSVRAAM